MQENYEDCQGFRKFINEIWCTLFNYDFKKPDYKTSLYEKQRMKKLIDNVFRDDEPIESKDVKLKNIKDMSKEFEKEENQSFEDAFEEEVIR